MRSLLKVSTLEQLEKLEADFKTANETYDNGEVGQRDAAIAEIHRIGDEIKRLNKQIHDEALEFMRLRRSSDSRITE